MITPEQAQELDLPLNPIKRNKKVREYLGWMGASSRIAIEIDPVGPTLIREDTLILHCLFSPFVGRRDLIRAAKAIEIFDTREEGE